MSIQTALSSAASVFGIRTADEPRYFVTTKDGANEVREYQPYWITTTTSAGPFEPARHECYQRLSDYLHGANSAGLSIQMAAPVFLSGAAGHWHMSFVLPGDIAPQRIPRAVSELVRVEGVAAATIATQRFTGRHDHDDVIKQGSELLAWLRTRGTYLPASEIRAAYYDPPFAIPVLRRNEVHVTVHRSTTLH